MFAGERPSKAVRAPKSLRPNQTRREPVCSDNAGAREDVSFQFERQIFMCAGLIFNRTDLLNFCSNGMVWMSCVVTFFRSCVMCCLSFSTVSVDGESLALQSTLPVQRHKILSLCSPCSPCNLSSYNLHKSPSFIELSSSAALILLPSLRALTESRTSP